MCGRSGLNRPAVPRRPARRRLRSKHPRAWCPPNVNDMQHSAEREHYLNAGHGLKSWLLTKDHKRIALLYMFTISIFFFIGGVFASVIRMELLTTQCDLVLGAPDKQIHSLQASRTLV